MVATGAGGNWRPRARSFSRAALVPKGQAYIYIYIYIYIHTYIHTYTHTIYTYMYVCVYMCVYTYIYIYVSPATCTGPLQEGFARIVILSNLITARFLSDKKEQGSLRPAYC